MTSLKVETSVVNSDSSKIGILVVTNQSHLNDAIMLFL